MYRGAKYSIAILLEVLIEKRMQQRGRGAALTAIVRVPVSGMGEGDRERERERCRVTAAGVPAYNLGLFFLATSEDQ